MVVVTPRKKAPRRAVTQAPIRESDQESGDASDVFNLNESGHDEGEVTDSSVGVLDDMEPPPPNPRCKRVNKNVTVAGQAHCRFCDKYVYRQMSNIQRHLEIHQGKGIQVGNNKRSKQKQGEYSQNQKQASQRPE